MRGATFHSRQLPGLRDRALIGLMVYTFARVGAAVAMRVEDYFVQGRRGWVRLHEKGGKEHEMPTHHNLDRYLEEYIRAAGIAQERPALPHDARPIGGADWQFPAPVRRVEDDSPAGARGRDQDRDRLPHLPCHRHGGRLEIAQQMAAHESARTTGLYDRRSDEISLDEVERIGI
jgi:integrase